MHIVVSLDRARLFRWHLALIEALRAAGHAVTVRFRDSSEPLPTSLTAILDFDRVRNRSGIDRFSTRLSPDAFARDTASTARPSDLTIDLSSSDKVERLAGRIVRPLYDGSAKDYSLFHALLDGHAPHLALFDSDGNRTLDIGQPALEMPRRLATSLDQVTSRLVEGIAQQIAAIAAGRPAAGTAAGEPAAGTPSDGHQSPVKRSILRSASAFASDRTGRKMRQARDKLTGDQLRWHTAWRRLPDGAAAWPQSGPLTLSDFRVIPDDGARFYADPFVFAREGVCHIFLEDLPDATGIGVISHTTIGADGIVARPRPVLETGRHLSYPFVFERDGHIWMLPEQSAGGGLELYRAAHFPDQWVHEGRLIDGRLHDATLFEHDGLLWIAAGSEAFQSSSWDALALYWATSLRGPWHPHARNPVVVDARAARPAGPLWQHDGALYRPAQDCSGGYGGAVTLNRITALTRDTFAEEAVGRISFGIGQNLLGPHTIGRGGGIEVVDIYARPGALRAGYRQPGTL